MSKSWKEAVSSIEKQFEEVDKKIKELTPDELQAVAGASVPFYMDGGGDMARDRRDAGH